MARAGPWLLICAAMLSVPAGCKSAPRTADLDQALADYEAKRYALAQQRAVQLQRGASGALRDKAAYLAGLCAYQRDDLEEARQRLTVASQSSHRPTAGNAGAVLGLVLLQEHRPLEAAAHFEQASRALAGADARQAAYHAAQAYQEAGDEAAADRWFEIAQSGIGREIPHGETRPVVFTLQVGAFRQRSHAQRALGDAARIAERHGLAPVRLVPSRDERGRTLYLVQIGRFTTRSAAADARTRLGKLQFIVAPMTRPRS